MGIAWTGLIRYLTLLQSMLYDDFYGSLELPEGAWFYCKLFIALILLAWPMREKFLLQNNLSNRHEFSAVIGVIMIWNYFWALINYLLPVLVPLGLYLWYLSEKESNSG